MLLHPNPIQRVIPPTTVPPAKTGLTQIPAGVPTGAPARFVVERFTAFAQVTPDDLALAQGPTTLTYGTLNARSSELAATLRTLGVGPDVVVGLCLDRSLAMIVGALAILKAGGAYLPMDPSYPDARLAFLLENAHASVVITGPTTAARVAWRVGRRVILHETGEIAEASPTLATLPPVAAPSPSDLAYVIYTSGSTGQPKGVEISHASLANLLVWHQRAFSVKPTDRASQIAKVSFDAAVWEIWPYLTAGASVHLADNEITANPEALRDWLVAERISIAFAPTPVAERLLTLSWPANTALRTLLTGADTLHSYPPSGLPFELINNYGPTECTVVATSGKMPVGVSGTGLPTIGRPIDNVQLYLLDDSLRPVTPGEPGEIYLGGVGVARGYRNRPNLTAERFVPNPFNPANPAAKLFKTGDLGKSLPNGEIAFLGRLDDQIKVRGYRIEPNEVGAALNHHPAVSHSFVMARDYDQSGARLIAYVVPKSASVIKRSELREFLAARLPEFMIPATFVTLAALPLTPHGKVDRAALPAPDSVNSTDENKFTPAQTDAEHCLAGLLAPLLKLTGPEQVDVGANFFELGGHSLLGTQLIARVRETFDINLPLRVLFEAPTVIELAAEIESLLVAKLETMSEDEVQQQLAHSELVATH